MRPPPRCGAMGAVHCLCARYWLAVGAPMWGTLRGVDPRIIFELALLFQFLGYIGLRAAIDDTQRADRISAVLPPSWAS